MTDGKDLPPPPASDADIPRYIEAIESHPAVRDGIAAQRALREVGSTRDRYILRPGVYKPERLPHHEKAVLALLLKEALVVKPTERTAVVILGLPASGKSSVLKGILSSRFPDRSWTTVDPDLVKEKLPDYRGSLAPLYHEESSDVSWDKLLPRAIGADHHVRLDQVGSTRSTLVRRLDLLYEAGYNIHAALADIPAFKSVHRVVRRYIRDAPEGRWVPLDLIPDFAAGLIDTWQYIREESQVLQSWARYDANVPEGEAPVLRESWEAS